MQEQMQKPTDLKTFPYEYSLSLKKSKGSGLGIYFCNVQDQAIVDLDVPFYKLYNRDGPGEASGVIYPGDILLRINQKAVGFKQMLEEMNSLQDDQMVDLEFGSYHEHWKVAEKLTAHSEKENEGLRKHIQEIETQLRRQNQCGILLEKKVASFRQQLFNMYQKHQDLNVRHNQLQKKMSSIEKHTVIEI